jgi:hypothetical protein
MVLLCNLFYNPKTDTLKSNKKPYVSVRINALFLRHLSCRGMERAFLTLDGI